MTDIYDLALPTPGMAALFRATVLCPCGHPWILHDVEEYKGDGTEMCCFEGCDQARCPGRVTAS